MDGYNPSSEEADEGTDEAVESGVDIVLNHRLAETYAFSDKKSYTAYLKDYMKKYVHTAILKCVWCLLSYLWCIIQKLRINLYGRKHLNLKRGTKF